MSSNQILFTRETHAHFYLPEEPFPYAFEDRDLKATLRDFLKVVREYPAYVETTHQAFYRLMVREGLNTGRSEELLRMTGREIPALIPTTCCCSRICWASPTPMWSCRGSMPRLGAGG